MFMFVLYPQAMGLGSSQGEKVKFLQETRDFRLTRGGGLMRSKGRCIQVNVYRLEAHYTKSSPKSIFAMDPSNSVL